MQGDENVKDPPQPVVLAFFFSNVAQSIQLRLDSGTGQTETETSVLKVFRSDQDIVAPCNPPLQRDFENLGMGIYFFPKEEPCGIVGAFAFSISFSWMLVGPLTHPVCMCVYSMNVCVRSTAMNTTAPHERYFLN